MKISVFPTLLLIIVSDLPFIFSLVKALIGLPVLSTVVSLVSLLLPLEDLLLVGVLATALAQTSATDVSLTGIKFLAFQLPVPSS